MKQKHRSVMGMLAAFLTAVWILGTAEVLFAANRYSAINRARGSVIYAQPQQEYRSVHPSHLYFGSLSSCLRMYDFEKVSYKCGTKYYVPYFDGQRTVYVER